MKQKTIRRLMAVLCVLLFGVSSAMAQSYLYFGGTFVNDNNKDNIVNSLRSSNCSISSTSQSDACRISYNSETHTLTLANCDIVLSYYDDLLLDKTWGGKALNLNLEGTNTIKFTCTGSIKDMNYYGFNCSVVIEGNGSLSGEFSTISTIYENSDIIPFRSLTVSSEYSGSFIEVTRENSSFWAVDRQTVVQDVTVPDNYMILIDTNSDNKTPENYRNYFIKGNKFHSEYSEYGYAKVHNKWLRIQPLTKYNLYVADTQADWKNEEDILGNGTVSYDRNSNTLSLKNANINYQQAQGQQPAVFYYSSASNDNTEGIDASTLKVNLQGTNILVSNATYGFNQGCTLVGNGNLNIVNPVRVFGGKVNLGETFTGWVAARSESPIKALNIGFPNTTDYFLARVSQLNQPLSAQAISETTSLPEIYRQVRFGKKDGSADPKLTLNGALGDKAHVGIALPENTHQAIVSNGHAPFYYTASNLPAGLAIDPNTGFISGKYTMSRDGNYRTTIRVHDLEGREGIYNVDIPVKPAMSFTSEANFELPDNRMVRGINPKIDIQCGLAKYMANFESPRTFSAVGLPEGMTITSGGEISGTPTAVKPDNTKATITVVDAIGQTASIDINVGRVFENYEFNVAGTLVTGINKDNIPVTGKTSGTISYDPETETLTFKNVVINNRNAATSYFVDSKISKINVVGYNSITYVNNASGASQYYGFPGNLEIYGDGSFGFSFGPAKDNPFAVNGNVTIMDDATIQLSAYYTAVNGTLTVPMNQVIYTANTTGVSVREWTMLNEVAVNVANSTNKYVKTERLANGALRFAEDFHLPDFLISIPMEFNLADYVAGGVGSYTYKVTGLPEGITLSNGKIIGTPIKRTETVNDITITVKDQMERTITKTVTPIVKSPVLNYAIYGGNQPTVSGTVYDWDDIDDGEYDGLARNLADNHQLMCVDYPRTLEEGLLTNCIARDKDGNWHADEIELTDGYSYALPEDVHAQYVYYTRTFSDSHVNKWQALCVPFGINVADYIGQFDIAELFAFCPYQDTNKDGVIDANDQDMLIVAPKKTGVTTPNVPYVIRPKDAKTYTIVSENCKLSNCKAGQVTFSTSQKNFKVVGILSEPIIADTNNGYYYMSGGSLSHRTSGTATLKPNKWYLEINGRSYGDVGVNLSSEGPAMIQVKAIGEDFDEETAIRMINGDFNATNTNTGIYNLNGMKMNDAEKLPRGIYIMNGKKVIIK